MYDSKRQRRRRAFMWGLIALVSGSHGLSFMASLWLIVMWGAA